MHTQQSTGIVQRGVKRQAVFILLVVFLLMFSKQSAAQVCSADRDLVTRVNSWVTHVQSLDNGSFFINGIYNRVNGATKNGLVKLTANGQIDSGFNLDDQIVPGSTGDFYLLPDGKIIVKAAIVASNGISTPAVYRLNSNGSIDTSFSVIEEQFVRFLDDGSFFTLVRIFENGVSFQSDIKLYSADGVLNTDFEFKIGAGDEIRSVKTQADGKILVGGKFSSLAGVERNNIARLNSDGTLDLAFNPNVTLTDGFFGVEQLKIQSDGKILIGGDFNMVGGTTKLNIARLNSDGSLDTDFALSSNSIVHNIILDDNDQFFATGRFFKNGVAQPYGAFLFDSDGQFLDQFRVLVEGAIFDMDLLSNSQVLIGGSYDGLANIHSFYLNRFDKDCIKSVEFDLTSESIELAEPDLNQSQAFDFSITRLNDLSGSDFVDYQVSAFGSNPVDEFDFVNGFPSGRVNFAPGESVKTISINVSGDFLVEMDETFELVITAVSNGSSLNSRVQGVIINDDTQDDDEDLIAEPGDNCPLVFNPDQQDLDEDNIGDDCDSDMDGDSVENLEDNCPRITNPEQTDTDGDTLGDLCDDDDDADTIDDDMDNCPVDFNPDQSDADENGVGDVCEPTEELCFPIVTRQGSLALLCI